MTFSVKQWAQTLGERHKQRREAGREIEIWRLNALINNFKRILFFNNAILEEMAKMERALGGEYIFDRSFLTSSVSQIASAVHHVTYNLNALTRNRYVPLYDRYQEIRIILDDILTGSDHHLLDALALELDEIGWELESQVGLDLICLSQLRHHSCLQAVSGLVIVADGVRKLCTEAQPEAEGSPEQDLRLFLTEHEAASYHCRLTWFNAPEQPVQEVASWMLEPVYSQPDQEAAQPLLDTAQTLTRLHQWLQDLIAKERLQPEQLYNLFLRPVDELAAQGLAHSRAEGRPEALWIQASLPGTTKGDHVSEECFWLKRTHPFALLESKTTDRQDGFRFADGQLATDSSTEQPFFLRGSGLLTPGNLKQLAETAMTLERLFGAPMTLFWEIHQQGQLNITGMRPLSLPESAASPPREPVAAPTILCQGGATVQSGVAAGTVVPISEETNLEQFPVGAVAVAKTASPKLTPLLQRAAALITEYGTAAGHLATVARELRLPALFGVDQALAVLTPGTEVTVDASQATVYQGLIPQLLAQDAREMELSPTDPEYRMLRRLLRFIMPLHLIDPESPDFSMEKCRSFHDIIHFCHEKAVDELAHFQERRPGLGAIRTQRMRLPVPLEIRVLDIGKGLATEAGREPTPDQVRSLPFALFLQGMTDPRAFPRETPSLGMGDIISSMPRSMAMLSGPAEQMAANLAIIGQGYLNISLRLGYHFSVIDANLGDDSYRNYVYFRFAGGLADDDRRRRRALFIHTVLKIMDFHVSIQGDLVIGRLKLVSDQELRSALRVLGALSMFARQRDTSLYSDEDAQQLLTRFTALFLTPSAVSSSFPPSPLIS